MDFKYIYEAVKSVSSASAKPIDDGGDNIILPQGAKESLAIGKVKLKDKAFQDFLTREDSKYMTHVGTDADGNNIVMYYKQSFDGISSNEDRALSDYIMNQAEVYAKKHNFTPLKPVEDKIVPKTDGDEPEINNSEDEYGKNIVSNIQKIMNTLSGESLIDLLDLAKSLKRRDKK